MASSLPPPKKRAQARGLTLVEVMFALVIQAGVMLAIMGSFLQSRRITESSVLHAASSSLVYGIIEQIKGLDYVNSLPNEAADIHPDTGAVLATPPFVKVRINQDTTYWLKVVYTRRGTAPKGPVVVPGPDVAAADVKIDPTAASPVASPAVDNFLGELPLSTVTGSVSQRLGLEVWLWIDELDPVGEAQEVKKVTLIYTYHYMDGNRRRTVRDGEVFLRTQYDK